MVELLFPCRTGGGQGGGGGPLAELLFPCGHGEEEEGILEKACKVLGDVWADETNSF